MASVFKLPHIVLILLTLAALTIRLWWLDRAPEGVLIDEGHFGYLAYSVLETGKDEHGVSFPIVFRGFGDYKLPVYAYSAVPFVKWLGLSTTAARLPSVLAGTLLVPLMYWLLKELDISEELSLIGAALVAFSPWTFLLSRFAFESNIALLLFTIGLAAMVRALRHKPFLWLGLAAVTWAVCWYTYIAYRPVTLGLAVVLLSFFVVKKQLLLKQAVLFFAIFGLLIAPLFHPSLAQSNTARLEQVGIFSEDGITMEVDEKRRYCTTSLPRVSCYILWNKGTVVARELLERFVHVYSPQFLATEGDSQLRYLSVEGFGQFFMIVYPLIIFGLIAVWFQVEGTAITGTTRWLVLAGLLIAPLPAVLSGDPQKVRLSPLVPFLIITCIYGWQIFAQLLTKRVFKQLAGLAFLGLFSISLVSFLINYYVIHSIKYDLVYQSYLPEVFERIGALKTDQTQVFIKPFFSDPIMAYAFYKKVDPQHYQDNVQLGALEPSGFQHAVGLDDYHVTEDPMLNVGCKSQKEGYQAYYLTNEQFNGVPAIDEYTSTTGAVNYAYLYDATMHAVKNPEMCLD